MTASQQLLPERLAWHFKYFATRELPGISPLYERLCAAISNDTEMLTYARGA
ncbi:MAG TPA: hypothetical protein VFA09_09870 [Ktedonobacteraceae bacterium]|jgi:hypothetical protein|nr:hypothetical protein [Ktedonobacteraceae bacterium]